MLLLLLRSRLLLLRLRRKLLVLILLLMLQQRLWVHRVHRLAYRLSIDGLSVHWLRHGSGCVRMHILLLLLLLLVVIVRRLLVRCVRIETHDGRRGFRPRWCRGDGGGGGGHEGGGGGCGARLHAERGGGGLETQAGEALDLLVATEVRIRHRGRKSVHSSIVGLMRLLLLLLLLLKLLELLILLLLVLLLLLKCGLRGLLDDGRRCWSIRDDAWLLLLFLCRLVLLCLDLAGRRRWCAGCQLRVLRHCLRCSSSSLSQLRLSLASLRGCCGPFECGHLVE